MATVITYMLDVHCGASLVTQMVKESARHAGDPGLIPGSGKSPGESNGNPLQWVFAQRISQTEELEGYRPRGHKELDTIE